MFLEELTPFVQELARQPVAFLGGFVSGVLHLNLDEDPVKAWLEKQNVDGTPAGRTAVVATPVEGPQKISID